MVIFKGKEALCAKKDRREDLRGFFPKSGGDSALKNVTDEVRTYKGRMLQRRGVWVVGGQALPEVSTCVPYAVLCNPPSSQLPPHPHPTALYVSDHSGPEETG